jgi:anti-sigma B factor antagonist
MGRYPVQWTDRQAVVGLPEEIDISNAAEMRRELLSIIDQGADLVIVDMGATTFCDSAGVGALVVARKHAVAARAALRLVVTAPQLRRIIELTGVDRLIRVYPTVAQALAEAEPGGDPEPAGGPGPGGGLAQEGAPASDPGPGVGLAAGGALAGDGAGAASMG